MWASCRFYQAGHPTDEETAKCPEPLCPTLVLPPLGRRTFHLLRGRYPRSSLIRAHVPLPLGSLLLRHLASFEESLQVVLSPCCPRELPDVISENLSLDAGSRTTAVPPGARTCFFPGVIGLPPAKVESASRFAPRITTARGPVFSWLQIFRNVPASKFAHPPGRPYRCAYGHRAAGAFTSGPIVLRYLHTHRIC